MATIHYVETGQAETLCGEPWPTGAVSPRPRDANCPACRKILDDQAAGTVRRSMRRRLNVQAEARIANDLLQWRGYPLPDGDRVRFDVAAAGVALREAYGQPEHVLDAAPVLQALGREDVGTDWALAFRYRDEQAYRAFAEGNQYHRGYESLGPVTIDGQVYGVTLVIPPEKPRPCEHRRFAASVAVDRLSDADDGPVTHYAADIRIRCAECRLPFRFIGLPGGLAPDKPTTSLAGDEARMPIEPMPADIAAKLATL